MVRDRIRFPTGLEGLVRCVTTKYENTTEECAKEKPDFEMMGKILDMNLVEREAHTGRIQEFIFGGTGSASEVHYRE